MFPVLFSLGPITFKTISLFLILAFLVSSFIFWRRGREEHYKEELLFDGFLLSGLVGVLAARAGYVVLNAGDFGFSLVRWLDFFSYPGFSGSIGLAVMGIYLHRFAKRSKWDSFEILDFWAPAMALGLAVLHVGLFFDGGGYGLASTLPWAVTFPGSFAARHPVQLYFAIFYVVLFAYLQWAEFHYRTFEWYRSGKKTAQTGFLVAVAMSTTGLVHVIFSFLKENPTQLYGIGIDQVIGMVLFFVGVGTLYVRSGKELPFLKRRRHAKVERL